MVITRTREELYKTLEEFSKQPGKLALIPTMGNLHDGHLSHKPSGMDFFSGSFNFLSFRLNQAI